MKWDEARTEPGAARGNLWKREHRRPIFHCCSVKTRQYCPDARGLLAYVGTSFEPMT